MKMRALCIQLLTALATFVTAYLLSLHAFYIASGLVLIIAACVLALLHIRRSGRLIDPVSIFTLSWLGGAGISALKLSHLSTVWSRDSWLSFFLAYAAFVCAYEALAGKGDHEEQEHCHITKRAIAIVLNIILMLSLISFAAEAVIVGYVPLFTEDMPHAYSYFHVSGLHYLTVSQALVPPLALIYLSEGVEEKAIAYEVIAAAAVSLVLPVLLVSRYQLIFTCLLSFFTFLIIHGGRFPLSLRGRTGLVMAGATISLVLLYIFITYERAHSIEYLTDIYEMKADFPIFFSQPYIYIANNFDNFNVMTLELPRHTHGLRMLFPFFALSGLKFVFPKLVSFPLYVTKTELTTLTFIYDAYYDFGLIGVLILSFALGALTALLEREVIGSGCRRPFLTLIYAELTFYLMFSFFTTWYSNASVWFYFAASAAAGLAAYFIGKRSESRHLDTDVI